MKVLVTGHDGYIGAVLTPVFQAAGHEVIGLDSGLFGECAFGGGPDPIPSIESDIRDVTSEQLVGYDAVVHLAALSNDPVGDLNPEATMEINHRATVSLARAAKDAGVERFLFSSSCSLYGAQGEDYIGESASFNPLTPYGESKILSERDLAPLADDDFSPVFLRNATAYGVSPRLRGDVAVNNLTGFAFTTGKVFLKSDGSSWRPLVHVEDVARAFLAMVEARRDQVHGQAFNIGATEENYQIRDVAKLVSEVVPGSEVTMSDEAVNDPRSYRVTCAKFEEAFPDARPRWTVRKGIEELYEAFQRHGLKLEDLEGDRFMRIRHIKQLFAEGRLRDDLRWKAGGPGR
ncbi:MAG: SDR family NAD-dependent epimerase/dehydratase [Actinobacteria bacterium]|nr:MAG: SDR family NAD-dependent epimerase/dehydratase [Actinomycetota bacterium]